MTEFIPSAAQRVALATREVERRMRNQPGPRARWFKHKGKSPLKLYELTLESPGEKDTIAWDADAGAFFVWGQPVDETAQPMVIDGEADVEKLWITAQYSDAEARVDGLSSFAVGHRVYTITRNSRREIVAPLFHDPRWEHFENKETNLTDAIAGGALRVDQINLLDGGIPHILGTDSDGGAFWQASRECLINGSVDVAYEDYGRCSVGAERPIWAAMYDYGVAFRQEGYSYGPINNSWLLYPGLAGYIYLGCFQTDEDGVNRALFMRDMGANTWWAKTKAKWVDAGGEVPYVETRPCVGAEATQPYDGTGAYPDLTLRVALPRNGSSQDPNVPADTYICYTLAGRAYGIANRGAVAVGGYLDGKIAEIRWLITSTARPAGWALADGIENSVPNGGSGMNLVGSNPYIKAASVPREIGGNLTHLHTPMYVAQTSSPDPLVCSYEAANHEPPYFTLQPHERIP